MLALDTNVVVRLLTRDDPSQAARARKLLDEHEVFIGDTVLLETEWVLRSLYGFSRPAVIRALRALAGLPNVTLENPPTIAAALAHAESGLDFADALHLARSAHCTALVTFDKALIRAARGFDGAVAVRAP